MCERQSSGFSELAILNKICVDLLYPFQQFVQNDRKFCEKRTGPKKTPSLAEN